MLTSTNMVTLQKQMSQNTPNVFVEIALTISLREEGSLFPSLRRLEVFRGEAVARLKPV